jgi:hypothetical protein
LRVSELGEVCCRRGGWKSQYFDWNAWTRDGEEVDEA